MAGQKRIFALGFFDGVHLGHQALLERCVALAREQECEPAAITFDRHPKALVMKEPPLLISTCADRHWLLKRYGIRYIREFPVIPEVTGMPWRDFLAILLQEGAAGFVCGDDFRFGWRGEGDAQKLQELCRESGLPCIIVPEQLIGGIRISSTYVRSRIEAGDMDTATGFLGHPYSLTGRIIRDNVPLCDGITTSRLRFPPELVVPRFGIYACRVWEGERSFPAVTYIGHRIPPDDGSIIVEPWIPDCRESLEGRTLTLEFHTFLRPETPFADSAALKAELERNLERTRQILE